MDRRIRIHFFPRDPSHARMISLPRKVGIALFFTSIPLCLIGFWLVLMGPLHENPGRKRERLRLERENRALREKTLSLQRDAAGLKGDLDSLEAARIRALMATGMESPVNRPATHTSRFAFFYSEKTTSSPTKESIERDLKRVQDASLFFDSSLFVLAKNRELAECFPTAFPLEAGALVMRPFGPSADPFTGRRSFHSGVDLSLRPGSRIYAPGNGQIASVGQDPLWGWYVHIRHTDRVETFFAHMQQVRVHEGETVARGQIIGNIGQSGATTVNSR